MIVLALETATPTASVAVLDGEGRVLAACAATAARHSSNLLRLVDQALRAAGLTVARLGGVAVGAGPGSFTGLRVGFAAAKGLCLPAGLPLAAVPSLDVLASDIAAAAPGAIPVACIDAGKGEVHARIVLPGAAAVSDFWTCPPATLCERLRGRAGIAIGGPGAARHADVIRAALGDAALRLDAPGPTAASAGRLALARLARGDSDDLASAVPIYGRPPDITKPRTRGPG